MSAEDVMRQLIALRHQALTAPSAELPSLVQRVWNEIKQFESDRRAEWRGVKAAIDSDQFSTNDGGA